MDARFNCPSIIQSAAEWHPWANIQSQRSIYACWNLYTKSEILRLKFCLKSKKMREYISQTGHDSFYVSVWNGSRGSNTAPVHQWVVPQWARWAVPFPGTVWEEGAKQISTMGQAACSCVQSLSKVAVLVVTEVAPAKDGYLEKWNLQTKNGWTSLLNSSHSIYLTLFPNTCSCLLNANICNSLTVTQNISLYCIH